MIGLIQVQLQQFFSYLTDFILLTLPFTCLTDW